MKRRLTDGGDRDGDRGGGDGPFEAAVDSLTTAQLAHALRRLLGESGATVSSPPPPAPRRFGTVAFGTEGEGHVNGFLHQKLGKEHLSRRAGPRGTRLTYIESCKAIELANQAFGFNGWSCRIVECKEEYREKKNDRWSIGFSSLVRIELKDGTSHEDVGFGQADGQPHLGAAIEQAKKASISDARKRALRLFGEYLGNSCYDREHIKDVHSNKPHAALPSPPVAIPAIAARQGPPLPAPPPSSSAVVGTASAQSGPPQHAPPMATLTISPPKSGDQPPPRQPASAFASSSGAMGPPGSGPRQPQCQQQQSPTMQQGQGHSASNVASRISALHNAEASRQANVRPPSGMNAAQGPAAAPSGMGSASYGNNTRPPASHSHPGPQPQYAPQVQQHRAFMPTNAPPPARMGGDYAAAMKVEPPRSLGLAPPQSEYDINDLSLSQFDYDPQDSTTMGPTKRMRAN